MVSYSSLYSYMLNFHILEYPDKITLLLLNVPFIHEGILSYLQFFVSRT